MKIVLRACTGIILLFSCSEEPDIRSDEPVEEVFIADEDRLPQFRINTNGVAIVDEPKINASLTLIEAGTTTFEGNIAIEIRGSSSQQFPKKAYGFETRDEENEDLDVELAGYPEEEDWILYAPYSDKALVRNHLIYELSNDMGRYASRTLLADVYLNDAYNGVYVFMEQLKRDDHRIDINKLKEDENTGEDLTGGYILKIDKADGAFGTIYNDINSFTSPFTPPNATSGQEIHFLYDDPSEEDITPAQKEYITTYVTDFENALASPSFADPEVGYQNYIETESFVDFFLLTELANNVDGYRISTWLTKDKNEKLKMGPIWDFNLAFGNANYCGGGQANVWTYRFNERCPEDFWQVPFWWERLLEDPAFVLQLQERWETLRASTFAEGNILNKIDSYTAQMNTSGSITTNFDTWPVLGLFVWPNNFIGTSYPEEVDYLKDWISERLSWMDGAIANL